MTGEAKGSLVSAQIELDPAEKTRSEFILHLRSRTTGENGTGATTRPIVGSRWSESGIGASDDRKRWSLYLSFNTRDVTISAI